MTAVFKRSLDELEKYGFSCIKPDPANFLLLTGVYCLGYNATGSGTVHVGVYDCSRGETVEGSTYAAVGKSAEDEFTVLGNCIVECDEDKYFKIVSSSNTVIKLEVVRLR